MRQEQINFLSVDGKTTIHGVKWIPERGEYHGILQITHGMVEFIERYAPFAEYLCERGFLVVGHDHLGHGGSVISQEEWGYFRKENPSDALVEDMHQLRMLIQKENPDIPYFMLGHSMGSYMLRKYLCLHSEGLAGAIVMGTGCMPDVTMKMGLLLCKIIGSIKGDHYRSSFLQSLSYSKPYKKYDLYGKDHANSWLTKDVEIVKGYYAEPRCTFLFTVNGYQGLMESVLYDNQVENIRKTNRNLPLFFVSGAEDPVGDCGKGVMEVYRKYKLAGCTDITYRLYEGDRHEILNEMDKEHVFSDICTWMRVRIEDGESKPGNIYKDLL